jgi:hypothetical protein
MTARANERMISISKAKKGTAKNSKGETSEAYAFIVYHQA